MVQSAAGSVQVWDLVLTKLYNTTPGARHVKGPGDERSVILGLPLRRALSTSATRALALAALAFALRCYGLTAPLLDYHAWRQADTAAIARNFMAGGYHLLYPQVDWGGLTPGYVESEFPLYTGMLSLLFGLVGPVAWPGRLLTALASAAATGALYRLMRPLAGERAALYGGACLAIVPFPLYFGRAVMPDSLMLLMAILALWSLLRWLEHPTAGRLAAALVCGALAPLAKTPNLLIAGVPLAYLALAARPPRRLWPALALYATTFVVPSLLWMRHAAALPLDPRLSFGIAEKLFDLRLLADPAFYRLVGRWSAETVLTWAGLPFFAAGLWPARRPGGGRFAWLPYFWLLGVALFFLAAAAGVVGQDYYILPLAGPGAWFTGVGLARVRGWAAPRAPRLGRFLPAAALVLIAALSFVRVVPLYRTADFYATLGRRVDLALPPGARVGVIAPATSEILFYGGRKGWRLDPGVIVPGGLASLGPDLGVRYVLIADPWLTERREVLTAALRAYRRVPVGPYALLLDLAQPGEAGPFEVAWETGHLVAEPFLSAWRAAGVARLGLPISEALALPEGRVQFFERGVLRAEAAGVRAEPLADGRAALAARGLSEERQIELSR